MLAKGISVHIPVYLIVKGTGLFDVNELEQVIVIDVKLTRASAEAVSRLTEGAKVIKMTANKTFP